MRNKKSTIVIISIMLFSVVEMVSCTNNSLPVPAVSFSKDIIPILTTNCALNSGCHLGANSTNLQINFDSDSAYATLFKRDLISTTNPPASLFYAEVEENQMPLAPYAPLSESQKNLILKWIQEGAKNN